MREIGYQRDKALDYAKRWALGRNPAYLDFTSLGGDCTNFISQGLFAGVGVMNHTPITGWYYWTGNEKAPAWTAAHYLHTFLLGNHGPGPYAAEAPRDALMPGDIVQLRDATGAYYHSLMALAMEDEEIYIAAHTIDSYWRPLSSYRYAHASYLKILGGRE